MASIMTTCEVLALVETYLHLEDRYGNKTLAEEPEFQTLRARVLQYRQEHKPADTNMRELARVLIHFVDETHKQRKSTAEACMRALASVRLGEASARAIKRSRLPPRPPAPKLGSVDKMVDSLVGMVDEL